MVAAKTGLFRFDGESFEQPEFLDIGSTVNGDVSALYTAPSGDFWGLLSQPSVAIRRSRADFSATHQSPTHQAHDSYELGKLTGDSLTDRETQC
jgi:hypothetical protein